MKFVMIQANIDEDKEATIAIFMNGLNCNITHIIELLHYVKLKEMVHMIVKVERQLKQKDTIWKSQLLGPLKPYRKYNIRYVPS
jgi:hypothetical protein